MDPKRDLDERLNIEGDPEDVIRALMGVGDDTAEEDDAEED